MTGGSFGGSVRTICGVLLFGGALAGASSAGAQDHGDTRFVLSGGAGVQTTVNARVDRLRFDLFGEAGRLEAAQRLGRTVVYDVGLSGRVWKRFGLGAHVTRTRIGSTARIEASVPHPFYFDFPRTATGVARDLAHQEWAMHLQIRYALPSGWIADRMPAWIPLGDRFRLTVFGGPSLYEASQDLVAAITPIEHGFPFEAIDIGAHATERVTITAVGFNLGLDVSYFGLGRFERLGLGASLRFNRAAPAIAVAHQTQAALELGGTQLAGGVRYAF